MSLKFAAGALLLYKDSDGERFVLLQCRSERECEPLTWCVYGGGAEPGETPAITMVREVEEEAGIDVSDHRPVLVFIRREPFNDFAYHTYAVILETMVAPVHSSETYEASWFKLGSTAETLWENLPRPLHSGMIPLIEDKSATSLVDMILR